MGVDEDREVMEMEMVGVWEDLGVGSAKLSPRCRGAGDLGGIGIGISASGRGWRRPRVRLPGV